jgi:hypothetical protein
MKIGRNARVMARDSLSISPIKHFPRLSPPTLVVRLLQLKRAGAGGAWTPTLTAQRDGVALWRLPDPDHMPTRPSTIRAKWPTVKEQRIIASGFSRQDFP